MKTPAASLQLRVGARHERLLWERRAGVFHCPFPLVAYLDLPSRPMDLRYTASSQLLGLTRKNCPSVRVEHRKDAYGNAKKVTTE